MMVRLKFHIWSARNAFSNGPQGMITYGLERKKNAFSNSPQGMITYGLSAELM